MYSRTLRKLFILVLLGMFSVAPLSVLAAPQFIATPMLIDGKGKAREIMHFNLTIQNKDNHLVTVYPWVDNYTSASGTQNMPDITRADLSTSLANWIEVTRGAIDLLPGESHDVPVLIQINMNAKPGIYHAYIKFAAGSNRTDAEANISNTLAIPVNIEVQDDVKERLQLGSFIPDKNWFTGASAAFHYRIQNIGNRGLVPRGKIHIFDRRGEEIATIDANINGDRLEPNNEKMLAAVWQSGSEFGKYKALLDMDYGVVEHGQLQDTVFFWVVPWQKMLGMFLSIIIASIIIAVLWHSRTKAGLAYARARSGYNSYDDVYRDEENNVFPHEQIVQKMGPSGRERLKEMLEQKKKQQSFQDSFDDPEVTRLAAQPVYERVTLEQVRPAYNREDHQVRLTERQKEPPQPEHIINLKR